MIHDKNEMRKELSDLININLKSMSEDYNENMIKVIRDYVQVFGRMEHKYFDKNTDDVRQLFLVQQNIALYSLEVMKRFYRKKYDKGD